MHKKTGKGVGQNKNFGPIQKLKVPDFQHITNVFEQMQSDIQENPAKARKQMKPFTIRKAAQPIRVSAQGANLDANMDSAGKYAAAPGDLRQDQGHLNANQLSSTDIEEPEETNLTKDELDALQPKELKVVNPWIYQQTHVETLPALRGLPARHANVIQQHNNVIKETTFLHDDIDGFDKDKATQEALAILNQEYEIFNENLTLPVKALTRYDTWELDRTPEEWIQYCSMRPDQPHAISPCFVNNEYSWKPVQVVSYDSKEKKFKVRVVATGQEKLVTRLSILFYNEDPELFRQRVNLCKNRMKIVEAELRFTDLVDSIPADAVSKLSDERCASFRQKCTTEYEDFDPTLVGKNFMHLIRVVKEEYIRQMKKCIVLQEMNDPANREKFQKKKVAIRLSKKTYPYYGCVKSQPYQFEEFKGLIQTQHWCSDPSVSELTDIFIKKSIQFLDKRFLNTEKSSLQLPMRLDAMKKEQFSHCELVLKNMQIQWREFLVSEIRRKLRDEHSIFESNLDQYNKSNLKKIIMRFEFILNNYMREFVHTSIYGWVDFIKSFTMPHYENGELWTLSNVPLLQIKLSIEQPQKKEDKDKKKKTKKGPDEASDSEGKVEGAKIRFKPSLSECDQFLQEALKKIQISTNEFLRLEKDLVTFLAIEGKPSFELPPDFPWLKDASQKLTQLFNENIPEPNLLLNEYRKFEDVINTSRKTLVKSLFQDWDEIKKNPNQKSSCKEIQEQIQKFHVAEIEIGNLSNDVVDLPIFRIHAAELKNYLINTSQKIKKEILDNVNKWCQETYKYVDNTYKEMIITIKKPPMDDEQLVTLREFIKQSKEVTMFELAELLIQLENHYCLMDEYCYSYNEKEYEECLLLKQYPMAVSEVINDGQLEMQTKEEEFTNKLEVEKENFVKQLTSMKAEFDKIKDFKDTETLYEYQKLAAALELQIQESIVRIEKFNEREARLNQQQQNYPDFEELKNNFQPFGELLSKAYGMRNQLNEIINQPLLTSSQDYESIDSQVQEWAMLFRKLQKRLDENFPDASDAAGEFGRQLKEFEVNLPLIKCIMSEALQQEDWLEIQTCLGREIEPQQITVAKFEVDGFSKHINEIEDITLRAEKKFQLQKKLKAMKDEMKVFNLTQFPYKDGTTFVLKAYDDVNAKIDDQTVATQGMLGSSNCRGPLLKDTKAWENKLNQMSLLIEEISKCQRSWMKLEPIFSSGDIGKTLGSETVQFQEVDKLWRQTMEQIESEPAIMDLAERDSIKQLFEDANKKVEKIERSLNEFLEQKRLVFPRFYFLANEDLLMILAQTKDPTLVQAHMDKCFEGIQKVVFSDKQEVTGMISAEGEEVQLNRKIDVNEGDKKGNVERWMLEIELVMRNSLKEIAEKSLKNYYQNERTEWVKDWPGQIVLAIDQIDWTKGVEDVFADFRDGSMTQYRDKLQKDILNIVHMVRGKLSSQLRTTLKALVVINVHGVQVVDSLINKQVQNKDEFEWGSQLRYYWVGQEKGKAKEPLDVRMVTAAIPYGFEYLGNSPRLVITPLTDRCYRTLMGAKTLNYGGAPEGPAGTGKTESVKDLAKALAVQCVVFNCSDGLDHNAMAKFFKGLASSGAWCCFDEFNRIDLEVLSVIAQQILVIQKAVVRKMKNFDFEGTPNLKLDPACAVNITMNPGYAGRSELPDNLKALFRPCAMMVPDYVLIGQIELYSFGFTEAESLSTKIVASLRLSSEQLSSQFHYDFGMRALKAILTACGRLRQVLDWSEDQIGLRALKDVNLPKFTSNDIPLYQGITSDLFPKIELPPPDYSLLKNSMNQVCESMNIQPKSEFLLKCIQLYETIMVRHGLMVVGQAYSGKSKIIEVLRQSFSAINNEDFPITKSWFINPKSIEMTQLYGLFDEDSGEWTDGVLAIRIGTCAQDESPERKWIIFDGPVDAKWIENMNTVLDDNKKLCLSSGAIIKLRPTMTIMFEVDDLSQASPATVSRCGMVLVETQDIGHNVLITSYGNEMAKIVDRDIVDKILHVMHYCCNCFQDFAYRNCEFPIPTGPNYIVDNFLKVFNSYVLEWKPTEDEPERVPKNAEEILYNAIVFSLVWGMGCQIDENGREKVNIFLRDLIEGENVIQKYNLDAQHEGDPIKIKHNLGSDYGSLFDLCFDVQEMKWIPWISTIPAYTTPNNAAFSQVIVPTSDSIRINYMINRLLYKNMHVLCCGPTGTGKSISVINQLQQNFQDEKYTFLNLAFSAQTSAWSTQQIIDNSMDRRRKGFYGPKLGKTCIIFVDDLNMPKKQEYGAQPPIELLRQWMDYGGWYEMTGDKEFRNTVDVTFVAAMSPPQGQKTISNRYVRHYNVIYVEPYSNTSLQNIFSNVLEWMFQSNAKFIYGQSVRGMKSNIVVATIQAYEDTIKRFKPTPTKSHYTYNLRDVSKVFQGIAKSDARAVTNEADMIKLWAHECFRVFSDRLISQEDRTSFGEMLKETMKSTLNKEWDDIIGSKTLLFGSYVSTIPMEGEGKKFHKNVYCELTDFAKLKAETESQLDGYNTNPQNRGKKMDLVLFEDAIGHVLKIHRVITTQSGNAMLVGVGGSGRKSLTELATAIAEYEIVTLEMKKGYSVKDWRDDIRERLFQASGIEAIPHVFLFSDTQMINEAFVEDINNILNNGKVPNLYPNDAMEEIIMTMKDTHRQSDLLKEIADDNTAIMALFEEQAKQSLHLVLAMSPIGEAFKQRLRMFPALVNCCTIDWFLSWPSEALESVARHFLKQVDKLPNMDGIVTICVDMQLRVIDLAEKYKQEMKKYYYVTPTSYLILIKTFQVQLESKRVQIGTDIKKFERGLKQLQAAAEQVDDLKEKLNKMIPELKIKAEESAKKQKEIEIKNKEVSVIAATCKEEADKATTVKNEAQEIEADCKEALDHVMPIYKKAISAVDKLKQSDVTELCGFKAATPPVALVAQSLCLFFDVAPNKIRAQTSKEQDTLDWWTPCKQKLLNAKLLQNLKTYDKDTRVTPELVEKCTELFADPNFSEAAQKKASTAGYGIGQWCKAIVEYDKAMKVVKPKQAALKEAKEVLAEAEASQAAAQAKLDAINAELQALIDELERARKEESDLRTEKDKCEAKVKLAELLINSLKSEKESWEKFLAKNQADLLNLEGDILIASGIMAYLGVFTIDYRKSCINSWVEMLKKFQIKSNDEISLINVLGDQVKISKWTSQGLPQDEFSIENAIILDHSDRWALMIDPQMQANFWLKRKLREEMNSDSQHNDGTVREPESVKPTMDQRKMSQVLEKCILHGIPCIFEDAIETFDPTLDPLLSKQIEKKGNEKFIKFGERSINFSDDFILYITTKMPSPHYSPETCVKMTLLNFQVTPEGLLDQMLNEIIRIEERTKYENRAKGITQSALNKVKFAKLQDDILNAIANSSDDILEDTELKESLDQSKEQCNQIEANNIEIQNTMRQIEKIREENKEVGVRVSRLFFVIADLMNVDPMYQYSLEFFKKIFEDSVKSAQGIEELKSRKKEKRAYWVKEFTKRLYNNVSRSLFQIDNLLFSFLLCLKIMDEKLLPAGLPQDEVKFLMAGSTQVELTKPNPTGENGWLTDKSWLTILEMSSKFKTFEGLDTHFIENTDAWKEVYDALEPQKFKQNPWPEPWGSIDLLMKIIIMRAIRPDKVIPMVQKLIKKEEALGNHYLKPAQSSLQELYDDSKNDIPIIIVISAGADPMTEIDNFSKAYKVDYESLSLGKGQSKKAEMAIEKAQKEVSKKGTIGTWVVLQNCHLAPSFMPTLDAIIEKIQPNNDSSFRIWLTTEPSDKFPVTIVQKSVKMTSEPPRGMQANMLKSYRSCDNKEFESCTRPVEFRRLFWGLCFFNAVILERRKYGPLGWNKPYEFSASDLRISTSQLIQFLDFYEDVPFEALNYMVAEANYGGRVTDEFDRRTIKILLLDYYNIQMIKEENHQLSESGKYYVPSDGVRDDYVEFIQEKIPLNDLTEIFGLHTNADITCAINNTNDMLEKALSLQPRATSSGGKSQDDALRDTCQEILDKLPQRFDTYQANKKHPIKYIESMNTVLQQEILRYNSLLDIIRNSLVDIQRAIKGEIVMSTELESVCTALFNNRIPDYWSKRSYPSIKPLASYIVDFVERLKFINDWIENGKPANYWISGFYFTQSFFTGLKQNYARKYTIAIDQINFDFEVIKDGGADAAQGPPDGAYIWGLFIEGCKWENDLQMLDESDDKVLFTKMPTIWLKPAEQSKIPKKHTYPCPVYKTLSRFGTLTTTGHSTNYVLTILLPMQQRHNEAHWVKRGVAMITQLSD